MKLKFAFLTLLLCVFFLPNSLYAMPKDSWTSVRSKNFFLIGNASEKDIKDVATRLEQFRDVFIRLMPGIKFNSPVPTTVVVLRTTVHTSRSSQIQIFRAIFSPVRTSTI
jgi:hypothetical protein